MMDEISSEKSRREEFLGELQREVSDPLHMRLIQAYRGDNPVQSMESELAKILFEVLRDED
jgi:Trp operon repressor